MSPLLECDKPRPGSLARARRASTALRTGNLRHPGATQCTEPSAFAKVRSA